MAADRVFARLWKLVEARGIDHLDPPLVLDAVAEILDEEEITYVRNLPLSGFGEPDTHIDLFVAPGIAILLDVGESAPSMDRLRRCASPPGISALAVLTDRAPDLYPAGHDQRHLLHGKSLTVRRIARGRP